jgi:rhamnosyltransferase
MNKVLVLLSTYNGEKYLRTQLESLKNQEGVELSVLVRDDGSKDSTLQILNEYAHEMDLSYEAAENIGSTRSFMELVRQCPGDYDYYAFCDQDDYWHEDKLITAVERLKTFDMAKPALYYSGQQLVDADMNPIYNHVLDDKRNVYANAIFNQMAGCTSVFNQALMKYVKHVFNNEGAPGFHDSVIYRICVLADGNIICDPEGKIDYRQHGSNVVGLDYSLKGKINKLIRYIEPGELTKDFDFIFSQDLSWSDQEKREFFDNLRCGNDSIQMKLWLLTHQKRISFHGIALRLIYNLKIITSKL